MNDDRANCDQRSRGVDEDDNRKHPMQAARQCLWNPHDDSSQQQNNRRPEQDPVELLLPGVEAVLRRHHLVAVLDVILDVPGPLAIAFGVRHIAAPERVHPEDGDYEDEANPRMPEANGWSAAEHGCEPIKMRSKERETGEHVIAIGKRVDPVAEALFERVAHDLAWRNNSAFAGN